MQHSRTWETVRVCEGIMAVQKPIFTSWLCHLCLCCLLVTIIIFFGPSDLQMGPPKGMQMGMPKGEMRASLRSLISSRISSPPTLTWSCRARSPPYWRYGARSLQEDGCFRVDMAGRGFLKLDFRVGCAKRSSFVKTNLPPSPFLNLNPPTLTPTGRPECPP